MEPEGHVREQIRVAPKQADDATFFVLVDARHVLVAERLVSDVRGIISPR